MARAIAVVAMWAAIVVVVYLARDTFLAFCAIVVGVFGMSAIADWKD